MSDKNMKEVHGMDWTDFYEFDDKEQGIVIKKPDTPAPWINYLSNGNFNAFISQAGGGFCWWKSPVLFRLTRYRHYNLPLDSPGFYIYLRHQNGEIWSPAWRPVENKPEEWSATHQPGKTVFQARKNNVIATLTFFVAPDSDTLIWKLDLKNCSKEAIPLDVYAYVELSQFLWKEENFFGYYIRYMLKVWYDRDVNAILYVDRHPDNPRFPDAPMVYFSSSHPTISYSCDRDRFCGNYRNERNPQAVENNTCGNSDLECGEPCAALQNKVELAAGSSETISFFLGARGGAMTNYQGAMDSIAAILKKLKSAEETTRQEQKLKTWWDRHLTQYQCSIPDADSQRMINLWTPVNSVHAARYSRSVNTVAPGVRGVGFRDSCQDMLAIAYRNPQWATDKFKYLLTQQYRDGHVVHATFPEELYDPWTSLHSDDHLWLPLLAHAILVETGNYSLLSEKVSYLGADHLSPDGEGTVWEHLLGCIRFTESHLGSHALPLTLKSDWNDIIGKFARKGKGESVFAGMQYVLALRDLIAISGGTGDQSAGEWLNDCLTRQLTALHANAWDGQWWRRGFDDDGMPFGAHDSQFGKLYLNPQSWAVIAGVGSLTQQRSAMEEVRRQLDTGVGLKKINPGFATWPDVQDPFSGYGPGTGENGAIFCHANTWAIIAEALLGNGDQAWQYFSRMMPHNVIRVHGVQRYQSEPYAWMSNIVGPENQRFGWGSVTHITGTSAWMDVAATQYLLGIRPELDGLRLAPCIPRNWEKFDVTRSFRNSVLNIRVLNQSGNGNGIRSISVDGETVESLIPASLLNGKKQVKITAVI